MKDQTDLKARRIRDSLERQAEEARESYRLGTAVEEKFRDRANFGTQAVDEDGNPLAPRGQVLTDQQLVDLGMAPYPYHRGPSHLRRLPDLVKVGIELPAEVVEMSEALTRIEATFKSLGKRVFALRDHLEGQEVAAQKHRVVQFAQGVPLEELEPFVPTPFDEPFSFEELSALRRDAESAKNIIQDDLVALTDQDTLWPVLAQAWVDSFVPDDFEASKAEIAEAEREGERVRQAILQFQVDATYESVDRSPRKEYMKFMTEVAHGPAHGDDYVAWRAGQIPESAIRVRPTDKPIDFAELEVEEIENVDEAVA